MPYEINIYNFIKSRLNRIRIPVYFALVSAIVIVTIVLKSIQETTRAAHQITHRMTAETFQYSVSMAKEVYKLSGRIGAVEDLPRFNSGKVNFNRFGFPVGENLLGLGEEPNSVSTCIDAWNGVLGVIRPSATADRSGDYQAEFFFHEDKPWCRYYYIRGGRMVIDYYFRQGEVNFDAYYGE